MLTVKTTISVQGDAADALKAASNALRRPVDFLRQVGVLGMSSSVDRLETVLRQDDDAIRTGRLGASLRGGANGGPDKIFDLSDARVEVGSNVPYAAQVHHGGIIEPKNGKALAIPLTDKLKRDHVSPRDIDPLRELLKFVPITGMKPNVVGVLVDEGEEEIISKKLKRKGRKGEDRSATIRAGEYSVKGKFSGNTAYGPGVLFAIAYWVTQTPKPFLFWSEEDQREVQMLFRKYIGWAA